MAGGWWSALPSRGFLASFSLQGCSPHLAHFLGWQMRKLPTPASILLVKVPALHSRVYPCPRS